MDAYQPGREIRLYRLAYAVQGNFMQGAIKRSAACPGFMDRMPSFFNALKIFRIVTELVPVDKDNNSLVTFLSLPYSLIKIRQ